jgi:hypothetical protein
MGKEERAEGPLQEDERPVYVFLVSFSLLRDEP